MTDEGFMGHPMDEVEVKDAMKNVAFGAREMFRALVDQGFTEAQAMKLVGAWMHGTSGGRLEQ